MSWIRKFLFLCAALWLSQPASAQVVATFYSHDFGSHFPHAFVVFKGTPVRGGEAVDTNYGFTAKATTPAILMGSVPGKIDIAKPGYVKDSNAHFSVTLTDAQYDAMMALVRQWSAKPDSVYNLNKHNCVHFAGYMALAAGLKADFPKNLMKKPRSYMEHLHKLNPGVRPAG